MCVNNIVCMCHIGTLYTVLRDRCTFVTYDRRVLTCIPYARVGVIFTLNSATISLCRVLLNTILLKDSYETTSASVQRL